MNERPEDLRTEGGEDLTTSSSDVRPKKPNAATSQKTARRRPTLKPAAIARVLLRQAQGPLPERRLVVAIITLAISDVFSPEEDIRRSARAFLEGPGLDHWASHIGLDGAFVRELARTSGYLPRTEPVPADEDALEQQGSLSGLQRHSEDPQ